MPFISRASFLKWLLALSSYGLIFLTGLFNFSWNISDHDDGHTIAYHVFGRNSELQRVYGEYDSMSDALLSLLPQDYYCVFGAMMLSTFIASFFVIYLLKKIAFQITKMQPWIIDLAAIAFLLAMPEFLYMSFTFKTVIISLAFILCTYYVVLTIYQVKYSIGRVLISSLIFGFAVSLRWNHLAFGLAIFVDLVYNLSKIEGFKSALIKAITWGSVSFLSALVWIFISGYSPKAFVETILWGTNYMGSTDFQLIARIGDASLFLLPFSLLAISLGLWFSIRAKSRNWQVVLLLLSSLVPYLILGLAPSFKYLSLLWPIFFILFVQMFSLIEHFNRKPKLVCVSLALIILAPWLIGIQIDIPTSNWGPGFDVRKSVSTKTDKLRLDDRFKISNLRIVTKAGIALPTSEGMRPLLGHFYTLFNGELKYLDTKLNYEVDSILGLASKSKSVIWVDRISPYLLAHLAKGKFMPDRSWNSREVYTERLFTNIYGDSITEFRINNPKNLYEMDTIKSKYSGQTIYALFTYTSVLNKLEYELEKEGVRIERLGALSAVISF